jgi:ABC-type nitrate/sulfonate/bicarbonate transport system substrate-binding protein
MSMHEGRAVRAGYATEGQGAGPLVVTQRAGLFTEEGLDVTITQLGSASGVIRGLLSGDVEFGNLAAPALVRASLEGAGVRYITGGINQQFLVGRPGIGSIAQLAGGRLGASGPSDLGYLLNQILIKRWESIGISGARIVNAGGSRERLEALLRGDIDATPMSPPVAIEARRAGCGFLLDFAELGLNFTLGGVATTETLIRDQPDLVRAFVRAYIRGMHRYKTDRDFTLSVQQQYSGIQDPSVAEETYSVTEPGFPRAPYPVTSGLAILLEALG